MEFENVKVNDERWFDLKPLKNEKFKNIYGYNGKYQISNYGRVKSMFFINKNINCKREKILKNILKKEGYYKVSLYKDNKIYSKLVHRLVANNFINKEKGKNIINHKDEDKSNNRIDNLEWCDYKYNCNYGNRNNKIFLKNFNEPKKIFKKVLQFDKKGNFIKEYENICIAEKETSIRHIRECCDKKRKSSKGYIFMYKCDY